jgi:EAL domain-containing protein (putative c-di-GMP-specific phosphodiesterase class I)/ActR/RegA family two-component response regulator
LPKIRLLILDDDAAVGKTIQQIAQSLGIDSRSVTRQEEFFQQLAQWNPDFISIDLAMPEMDGVEVLQYLAERECRCKIIITSGMGNRVLDAARRSATQHGLDFAGVLTKPLTSKHLKELIRDKYNDKPGCIEGIQRVQFARFSDRFAPTREELARAIEREEFVVMYQPQIHCYSKAIAGFEALIRWKHPERGMILPPHFVSAAEDFELIDALTAQVFRQSVAWLSRSLQQTELSISLNISARSLLDYHLAEHLSTLCREFSITPERIVLELTESSAMTDPLRSLDLMTRFRVKGFQLSIDDFGTGFSSMVQLVRLPFTEIKIDRSFVAPMMNSSESLAVTRSIVNLGSSLGLRVTAEGIEDAETLNYLGRLGCDLAQGYYISKPMSGDAALDWTRSYYPEVLAAP